MIQPDLPESILPDFATPSDEKIFLIFIFILSLSQLHD